MSAHEPTTRPLPPTAQAALLGEDLRAGYGPVEIVHGVSLSFEPGVVTALIGPNGSGKSTLLRALARLSGHTGTVSLGDTDAAALTAREFAQRLTMLAQHRPVPTGLTVAEVVEFGRHPRRGRWRKADPEGPEAIARALDLTGLTDLADRPVDALSGGQLQRVWLASCLAQDTGVLLLDEPTTFLDLRHQVELLDLVRELADSGLTVGVVLHDLNQAAEIADHVVLLDEGTIVAAGPPGEVLTSERLSAVYGVHVEVTAGPTGVVDIRPRRARARHTV